MNKNIIKIKPVDSKKPTDHIKHKFGLAYKKSKTQTKKAENDSDDLLLFVQKYPAMLAKYPWMINRYPHLFANNKTGNIHVRTIH